MDILIQDIQNRLTESMLGLAYIDEDWGQLDDYSPNFPVKWPCALIDVADVEYSNVAKLGQLGEAVVTITIADIKLTNSSSKAPARQKAGQANYWLLINDVHLSLHGFSNHNFYSKLIRKRIKKQKRDDGVRSHQLIYTCRVEDASTIKPQIKKPATINLEVEAPTFPADRID